MRLEDVFGNTLRSLRISKGFSQEGLALECDLDRTYISLLERGKRSPSLKTIFILSEPLDIAPSMFVSVVEKEIFGK